MLPTPKSICVCVHLNRLYIYIYIFALRICFVPTTPNVRKPSDWWIDTVAVGPPRAFEVGVWRVVFHLTGNETKLSIFSRLAAHPPNVSYEKRLRWTTSTGGRRHRCMSLNARRCTCQDVERGVHPFLMHAIVFETIISHVLAEYHVSCPPTLQLEQYHISDSSSCSLSKKQSTHWLTLNVSGRRFRQAATLASSSIYGSMDKPNEELCVAVPKDDIQSKASPHSRTVGPQVHKHADPIAMFQMEATMIHCIELHCTSAACHGVYCVYGRAHTNPQLVD